MYMFPDGIPKMVCGVGVCESEVLEDRGCVSDAGKGVNSNPDNRKKLTYVFVYSLAFIL